MFEPTSRYARLEKATHTTPDGRVVSYVRRRFLPRGAAMPLLMEHVTREGERLDQVTARALGDPEHYWRVCDANDAMNPRELTDEPGRRLRIPIPEA